MRSRIASLMFSVFLIGLGSAIFFFEISEYTFEDWRNISFPESSTTVTDIYTLEGIDNIDAPGAEIFIDETQEGIKVEITYNKDIVEIAVDTTTLIHDCTKESSTICDVIDKDKITSLVPGYTRIDGGFNFKNQLDFMINQAKNKKIIVNIFALMVPTIKVTVNSETYKLLNQ